MGCRSKGDVMDSYVRQSKGLLCALLMTSRPLLLLISEWDVSDSVHLFTGDLAFIVLVDVVDVSVWASDVTSSERANGQTCVKVHTRHTHCCLVSGSSTGMNNLPGFANWASRVSSTLGGDAAPTCIAL